jgi:predicted CopG family antitoxin
MGRSAALRKERKTFSLSREAVAYLESMRKKQGKSTSEVLEELILARKLADQQERISQNIRNYYDSLCNEEQAENRVWGEFAESQLGKTSQ